MTDVSKLPAYIQRVPGGGVRCPLCHLPSALTNWECCKKCARKNHLQGYQKNSHN